ncbi:hypothetical protein HDU91_005749, partial [Kappamyces sp. JEL0680]
MQFSTAVLSALLVSTLSAAAPTPAGIDRVFVIVFENENQDNVLKDPYFGTTLPAKGRLLTNYHAATHPSQGNYVAMITGGLQG